MRSLRRLAALALLAACAPPPPPPTVPIAPPPPAPAPVRRGPARPALVSQAIRAPGSFRYSPDGGTFAVSTEGGVLLVDPVEGAVRGVIPDRGFVGWAEDSATLLVASAKELSFWDAAAGKKRASVSLEKSTGALFVPRVAIVTREQSVDVHDPVTGEKRASLPISAPPSHSLGDGGKRLLGITRGGALELWDLDTGAARVTPKYGGAVADATLGPDEGTLATVLKGAPSALVLWDVEAGRERGRVAIPEAAKVVRWSPSGKDVTVEGEDRAYLVHTDSMEVVPLGPGPDEVNAGEPAVVGTTWSPTGSRLGLVRRRTQYTGSTVLPPSVHAYHLTVRDRDEKVTEADVCRGITCGALNAAFRSGDERVALLYDGWSFGEQIIDTGLLGFHGWDGAPAVEVDEGPPTTTEVGWDKGGAVALVRAAGLRAHWPAAGGAPEMESIEQPPPPQLWGEPAADLSPTEAPAERGLGTYGDLTYTWFDAAKKKPARLEVWSAAKRKVVATFRDFDKVLGTSVGDGVIVAVRGDALVLVATATGKVQATLRPRRAQELSDAYLHWSPDGRVVVVREVEPPPKPKGKGKAVASPPREALTLWDARTGKKLFAAPEGKHTEYGDLDRPVMAFATPDRVVVVDARSGAELASLPGARCDHISLVGERVLAACHDSGACRAKLWDVKSRAEIPLAGAPEIPNSEIPSQALGPGGALVASANRPGEGLKLWDGKTGALIARMPGLASTDFAFRPDGRFLVMAADEGATVVRLADRKRLHLTARVGQGLAFTDDLLFDGPEVVSRQLHARLGGDLLRADTVRLWQLAERYERRGLVADFFAGKAIDLPKELEAGAAAPPGLRVRVRVEGDKALVHLHAADRGGGLAALHLTAAGKPVEVPAPTPAELAGGEVEREVEVPMPGKTVEVVAWADGAQGTRSAPHTRTVEKK